jgi:hypothetical protein
MPGIETSRTWNMSVTSRRMMEANRGLDVYNKEDVRPT